MIIDFHSKIRKIILLLLRVGLPPVYKTRGTAAPITVKTLFFQKILGFNRAAYWPMHFTSTVTGAKNIQIGIGTAPGLSPGCYIQGGGQIYIGHYTIVAPNVGIISANHEKYNLTLHKMGNIHIGDYCWLGMNSVILPDVILGDFTIVAAGAVVTKSFPDGYCVLAGNPGKVIKRLNPVDCVKTENMHKYRGYIQSEHFENFRKKNLSF